jgi:hypothetical protein
MKDYVYVYEMCYRCIKYSVGEICMIVDTLCIESAYIS